MAGRDEVDLLEYSSQFLRWRFTSEELASRRRTVNEQAKERITSLRSGNNEEYLTPDEELALCNYYAQLIPKICAKHKLSESVALRAVVLHKRYYVARSVMDWHPNLIAIYLAYKLEASVMDVKGMDTFLQPMLEEMKDSAAGRSAFLKRLELAFLEGVNFDIRIQLPLAALEGLQMDILKAEAFDPAVLKQHILAAKPRLTQLMLTDGSLIYMPPQLAFAALHLACVAQNAQRVLEDYVTKKLGDDNLVGDLYACVQELEAFAGAWSTTIPAMDRLKQINAKLAQCCNPTIEAQS